MGRDNVNDLIPLDPHPERLGEDSAATPRGDTTSEGFQTTTSVPLPLPGRGHRRYKFRLRKTRAGLVPLVAERCLQCHRCLAGESKALNLTQLPPGLLGFLPLSVALPLLFPILITFLVAMRKSATLHISLCAICYRTHRRAERARRVTGIATAGFALSAPLVVVLTVSSHVAIACAWFFVMAALLTSLLMVRRRTEAHVFLCERIDGEGVVLSVPGAFAAPGIGGPVGVCEAPHPTPDAGRAPR